MTANKDDLDHRVADAFAAELSSTELSALLQEVRDAAAAATVVQVEADRLALDPATRPEAVRAAREASVDATFRAARFTRAVEGLEKLLTQAKQVEADVQREAEHRAALAERETLIKDIAEIYPRASAEIVALLGRIERSNARIGGAEAIARGAPANWATHPNSAMPTLTNGVRLPTLGLNPHGTGFAWDGLQHR